jgi:kynureninase
MSMPELRKDLAFPVESEVLALDAHDPLASFRERFFIPPDTVYLDGNSLGLLSRDAEEAVLGAMSSWKEHGVEGWLAADPPWFTLGEALGRRMAPMLGAAPDSVVVTGTTTVNLHQLVGTFYRPEGGRRKIIATALDFPSDVYALQSQIRLRGGDPACDLVLVPSRDGRTIAEEDIITAMTEDVALVMLPSVLYRSGQLLDMPKLTAATHDVGAIIGFDCAHSAGAIPHALDAWNADFAFWCSYKYLNAGPGAVGALYVNRRHFGTEPALAGWWGYRKDRQFEMTHHWEGAGHAGAWQISTIPLLSAAALLGSLSIFEEAGIDAVREKSLAQTDLLIELIESSGLSDTPYGYRIGTPREHSRRGGHVAVEHPHGAGIARALRRRGIVVDFRPPDVVRLAPVALYTSYQALWQTVAALRTVIDTDEHTTGGASGPIT